MEDIQSQPEKLSFIQKFVLFIRTQGVIGLAVAVVLGGAVQRVVSALVNDMITPLIGLFMGKGADLKTATFTIRDSVFAWGNLVSTVIDFLIIAFVIYLLVKILHADMLDKPKS
jgi:large conductance mechanosensitive channel